MGLTYNIITWLMVTGVRERHPGKGSLLRSWHSVIRLEQLLNLEFLSAWLLRVRLLLLLLYILFVCSQKVEMELSCFRLLGRLRGPRVCLDLWLAGGRVILSSIRSCLLLYAQGHWLYVERLLCAELGGLARHQVRPLG